MRLGLVCVLLVAAYVEYVAAVMYLPGVAPVEYQEGQRVPIWVNKVLSAKTQIPYRYNSLPVCQPKHATKETENLGEILVGDRIESSDYVVRMKEDKYCSVLCRRVLTGDEAAYFRDLIRNEYHAMWIMDNLPASVQLRSRSDPTVVINRRGFALGEVGGSEASPEHYLYNHLHFVVKYNPKIPGGSGKGSARVVGFEVEPFSVQHSYEGRWKNEDPPELVTCNSGQHVDRSMDPQRVDHPGEVIFTYDVEWVESDVEWSHRWDVFLTHSTDRDIHWFSVVNSVVIMLFLTGIIATILVRALYRDLARYNSDDAMQDAADESGWKLIHGDVFRPPDGFFGPMFLSVFVASGAQLLATTTIVIIFAVLGFLSPANRGGLLTTVVVVYVLMGAVGGFTSARLYKRFQGKAWKRNTFLTASAFPVTAFFLYLLGDFVNWAEKSSAAVPFSTILALFALWLGVMVPLTFLGSYYGFTRGESTTPVPISPVRRLIPPQPFYLHIIATSIVGGLLPFGAAFVEVYYIMSSIWLADFYYLFGFLLIATAVTVITSAEVSICMVYLSISAEDSRWWWRGFLTAASSGVYLFLYGAIYWYTRLEIIHLPSVTIYFIYMFLASWAFFLVTGSVGFLASHWFMHLIFSSIKVD